MPTDPKNTETPKKKKPPELPSPTCKSWAPKDKNAPIIHPCLKSGNPLLILQERRPSHTALVDLETRTRRPSVHL